MNFQETERWKPPSRPRLALMLGASLMIVGLVGLFASWAGQASARASRELTLTESILASNADLLSALKDAETGQRGFLLTGREEYLGPYRKALASVPAILRNLWNLTPGRPDQVQRLKVLDLLIQNKLAEVKETLEFAQEGRRDQALSVVERGEGKATMDEILRKSQEIKHAAATREAGLRAEADSNLTWLRVISTAGAGILFVFVAWTAHSVLTGIDQREELLQKAQASRELLSITLSSIGDAVVATDTLRRITFINPVAQSLTGWTEADALGRGLSEVFRIVDEATRQPVANPVERALTEGGVVGLANHANLLSKDGTEVFIDDSAAPIRNSKGRVMGAVLVFRDIGQQRDAERALRESEEFARRIVESSPDCVKVLDLDGRLLQMNANGCRQMEIDDFSYCRNSPWCEFWPEQSRGEAGSALEAARAGETATFQGSCPTAKGTERWWEVIVAPIRDAEGVPVRILSISRDVTERVLRERQLADAHRRLEVQAAELGRSNEDLAQFAYAASHDLRAPLNSVHSFAELLSVRFGEQLGHEGQTLIGFIIDGSERMQRLVTDLLAFARAGRERPDDGVAMAAQNVLETALEDLRGEAEEVGAQITTDPLPEVGVQETHLRQLLQNIIGNAIKYRGTSPPRIHISASPQGDKWLFSVTDNGTGIDATYLDQIFQPFKRLHGSEIVGSGIGLATCRRIVSGYGGAIWAESTAGAGSRFFFTVPKAPSFPKRRVDVPAQASESAAANTLAKGVSNCGT